MTFFETNSNSKRHKHSPTPMKFFLTLKSYTVARVEKLFPVQLDFSVLDSLIKSVDGDLIEAAPK